MPPKCFPDSLGFWVPPVRDVIQNVEQLYLKSMASKCKYCTRVAYSIVERSFIRLSIGENGIKSIFEIRLHIMPPNKVIKVPRIIE